MESNLIKFIEEVEKAYKENAFKKIIISKPTSKDSILKIGIRIIDVKKTELFSFTYEYDTKHIVKNYPLKITKEKIDELLGKTFLNAILFTENNDIQLIYNKKQKSKLRYGKATLTSAISKNHNREKNRFVSIENNIYLQELGITTKDNEIIPKMSDKYKQINKFIETVDSIVKNIPPKDKIKIVDMGSGKGYLTFAIYDFVKNSLKQNCQVIGVEIREGLVELCNNISSRCGFSGLFFISGTIQKSRIKAADILIALHACDTATDDAIYKGIISDSSAIIVAPCCHKQIRKEFDVTNEIKYITRHGILEERLAESVTDTLRSLILEYFGYKTQIFEFISDEHTHKNIMIVAVQKNKTITKGKLNEISKLKNLFGIKDFYLENLLEEKLNS